MNGRRFSPAKFVLLTFFCSTMTAERGTAQNEQETYLGNGIFSIDVPTDARGIAMGESFVALPANASAMFYNPASLGGIRAISVSYARRSMDWIAGLDKLNYQSVMATIPTSLLNIGLSYNRFTQGELIVTTPQDPEGDGTTITISDHTLGLGLAMQFDGGFSAGVSVKTFNMMYSSSGPSGALPTDRIETTKLPLLFDLGMMYNVPFGNEGEGFQHGLAFGLSAQNLGTTLRQKQQTLIAGGASRASEYTIKLPRYIRFGLSYSFQWQSNDEEALSPLAMLLTAEYRNSINSLASRKDYWGFGLEMTLFEIASVKLGGFTGPYSSIYGQEGTPALRYGFGASAPFNKLGANIPLALRAEYTLIPINNVGGSTLRHKSLDTFSVGVEYETELF